jgi:NADH-quinone oxidoreductase subunit L
VDIRSLLLIVLFAPGVGMLLNGFFGARWGKRMVGAVACGAVGLAFAASAYAVYQLVQMDPSARTVSVVLYQWIGAGDLSTQIGLLLDPLSSIMILVVSGVSTAIHIYSTGYMADDKKFARYFTYLNLFVFFMLILVLSDNFLLFFVGWEGVGLCSYLLIGFWFHKASAADAGKKAFIVNRIGDFGFLLAIMAIFLVFGTLQFQDVFAAAHDRLVVGGGLVVAITLLLFMGATGKSAQIPLYTWLPDAMEGPTPVSALIHAATMVTAGVYMVVRCHVLFEMAPVTLAVVAGVGLATALFAASIGLVQNDIKRVLAYSTVSQLGYMFVACGIGAFTAGMFHLMTHAFFKALLFLAAGSVMHGLAGELDVRKMGGLKKYMPYTYWTFLIGALALAGVFPFAGFFSKDEILWHALEQGMTLHWILGLTGALMTAFYVFRLFFLAFHGKPRTDVHAHESPANMTGPLVFLAILSIGGGFLGLPVEGGGYIQRFLAPMFGGGHGAAAHGASHASHAAPLVSEYAAMGISLAVALTGIFIAWRIYLANPGLSTKLRVGLGKVHTLLYNKYYVDEIYDFFVVKAIIGFSRRLWHWFDDPVIDGAVNGMAKVVGLCSGVASRLQNGRVHTYAWSVLLGAVIVIGYYLLK